MLKSQCAAVLLVLLLTLPANAQTFDQTNVMLLVNQANELVAKGDFTAAQANFEQAIADSIWDKGKTYSVTMTNENSLDAKRLAYGTEQLNRMLNDRPHMNAHGIAESPIAQWCIRRFAGIETGILVRWNSDGSMRDFFSDHRVNRDDRCIDVRIANSKEGESEESLFEASWGALVFELINGSNWRDFQSLNLAATAGDLTSDFFVKEYYRLEHDAAQRCRAVYVRLFLPWAAQAKIKSEPRHWFASFTFWGTPETTLHYYQDRTKYPWVPYETFYQDMVAYGESITAAKPVVPVKEPSADRPNYRQLYYQRLQNNRPGYSGF